MRIIGPENLKAPGAVEVSAGRLSILDKFAGTHPQEFEFPIKFQISAILLCTRGSARIALDSVNTVLHQDEFIFVTPESILEKFEDIGGDCNMTIIMIAAPERYKSVIIDSQLWDMMMQLRKEPVLKLSKREKELAASYRALVSNLLQYQRTSPYTEQVLASMADAFFYQLLGILTIKLSYKPRSAKRTRGQRIFLEFIDEINKSDGRYTSVQEMADRLCVSTKYLARVVKQNSDMSPSEWMDECTMRAIVTDLRHTNKSMKAIALAYGFPNPSSFGTFFRRHAGVSPAAYRVMNR